jgi:lipopolysaccharide/colanic/teichoic acid biosynthesis glycosyltransferase
VLDIKSKIQKRAFDIVLSLSGLLILWPVILFAVVAASIDTKEFGLFTQMRVGREGRLFRILKIRTMRTDHANKTFVTTSKDSRITILGALFRRYKIDELPQLLNIIIGDMSFVGPRPDVPGYADKLENDDRIILSVRPGITGPAAIKYRDEEELLQNHNDPEEYNDTVIYPDKVRINREYVMKYSFVKDIKYILKTIFK